MLYKKQTAKDRILSGTGWAFLGMFVGDLIEEGVESIIAVFLTDVFTGIIFMTISALGIVCATTVLKTLAKRFLLPFIRELTYREGNDKVEKTKNFFKCIGNFFATIGKWINANKKSLIGSIGAFAFSVLSAYTTWNGYFSFIPDIMIGTFNVSAVIVGLICWVCVQLGVNGKGFEAIQEYAERIKALKEQKNQEKHDNTVLKLAKKQNKEEDKLKKKQEAEQKKEEARKEAQTLADENKDADAKLQEEVDAMRAKLRAEKNQ